MTKALVLRSMHGITSFSLYCISIASILPLLSFFSASMVVFASVVTLPNFHSISIELDRTNYAFWRAQILDTTRAHKFDDLLNKYHNPPSHYLPSSSGNFVANPDFLAWIRCDQWLLSSIGESMFGHVTHCITTCDIWTVFENLFQSRSKARIMQLQLQLQTTEKEFIGR